MNFEKSVSVDSFLKSSHSPAIAYLASFFRSAINCYSLSIFIITVLLPYTVLACIKFADILKFNWLERITFMHLKLLYYRTYSICKIPRTKSTHNYQQLFCKDIQLNCADMK